MLTMSKELLRILRVRVPSSSEWDYSIVFIKVLKSVLLLKCTSFLAV